MTEPKSGEGTSGEGSESESAQTLTPTGSAPEESSGEVGGRMLVEARFAGPLPPPSVLEGYEAVVEGSAERILALAEGEAAHRRGIENRVVESNIRNEARGQMIGGAVAIFAIAGAVLIGIFGNPIAGSVAATLIVALFTWIFRTALRLGRRDDARE